MLLEDKEYIVDIVDIGHGGVGVGKYDGFTVFIDGGLIEDKLKVKINKCKKNYAVGKIVEVIKSSPYRVARVCSEDLRECGGCQIQELDYNKQLEIKTNEVKQSLIRIGGFSNIEVNNTLGMEKPFRYRNKAQFPISEINTVPAIGFYKKKSHDLISADKCIMQHEINDKIMHIIKTYIRAYNISIYNEKTQKGLIRHLVTRVGYFTNEVMIILVINGDTLPYLLELCSVLRQNIHNFSTLVLNINKKNTNSILGKENKIVCGEGKIQDTICDLKFNISPLSFYQVNPIQTEVLYKKALEFADLQNEDVVFDIYCGIGTISLFLARHSKVVYGIEIVPEAIKDAKENARLNRIFNARFYAGKAEELIPKLYNNGVVADVVVVDPPRKGCEQKVLETIAQMKPKKIVYVSCNPSTLARDLRYLHEHGFKCVEVQPVDMFPHSMHVETVAKIIRV